MEKGVDLPEEVDYRMRLEYAQTFDLDGYDQECEHCRGQIVYDDSKAELVCSRCGFVLREKIETIQQSMSDDGDLFANIHNSPIKGTWKSRLSAVLGKKDVGGRTISSMDWTRLRKIDMRIYCNPVKEKTDVRGSVFIQQFAGKLGLTQSIIETTLHLFIKVNEKKLCKGRTTANFALACIYIACRMHNAARTWQELVELIDSKEYHIDRSKPYTTNHIRGVKKAIRLVEQELSIKSELPNIDYLINRVVNGLPNITVMGQRDKILKTSLDMYNKVKDEQIMIGKNPQTIAAACVYIAGLRVRSSNMSQLLVANSCNTSVVSLRKRCIDVYKVLNLTDVPSIRRELIKAMQDGEGSNVSS